MSNLLDRYLIGENLRKIRESIGESQTDVARAINVTRSAYCMYENGDRIPQDDIKVLIADHFETTVDKLFFDFRSHKV